MEPFACAVPTQDHAHELGANEQNETLRSGWRQVEFASPSLGGVKSNSRHPLSASWLLSTDVRSSRPSQTGKINCRHQLPWACNTCTQVQAQACRSVENCKTLASRKQSEGWASEKPGKCARFFLPSLFSNSVVPAPSWSARPPESVLRTSTCPRPSFTTRSLAQKAKFKQRREPTRKVAQSVQGGMRGLQAIGQGKERLSRDFSS